MKHFRVKYHLNNANIVKHHKNFDFVFHDYLRFVIRFVLRVSRSRTKTKNLSTASTVFSCSLETIFCHPRDLLAFLPKFFESCDYCISP